MISRRSLLAGSLAAPLVANAAARARAVADIDVAIIGAGAAGLHAARHARAQGLTARIFEARTRVGGVFLPIPASARISRPGFLCPLVGDQSLDQHCQVARRGDYQR